MTENQNRWHKCSICGVSFGKNASVYTILTGAFVNADVVKYDEGIPNSRHVSTCCMNKPLSEIVK